MKTSDYSGFRSPEEGRMITILLLCGILSSVLYVCMTVFLGMHYDGYSAISQTVSEISAVDSPMRPLWLPLGIVYTILVAAFGWGVRLAAGSNRKLRRVGNFIFIYGCIGILWVFTPMHQRDVLVNGGGNWSDTMHIVMAMVSVFFMFAAIILCAGAFGTSFKVYSIVTLLIFLVFGILTSVDGPKLSTTLPTPYIGVWERINIGAFDLWVIVLAFILLTNVNRPASQLNAANSR